MSNYFIIHGSFSNPHGNWFGWLAEYLRGEGHEVYVPDFPIGVGKQNFKNWNRLLKYYHSLGLIDENTTIIGHSIAPIFICKFLIKNQIKVKKLIFVSGFNNYLGINQDFDSVNKPMYLKDVEKVKEYAKQIVCFYSDNDPYVKFEVEQDFANRVATKKVLLKGAGHINAESGFTKFEEIIKYL